MHFVLLNDDFKNGQTNKNKSKLAEDEVEKRSVLIGLI